MLQFVTSMACLNVVNMLLMTPRYVVGRGRFLLRMSSFFSRRLLLGLRKVERVDRSGLWLEKIPNIPFKN
jgi:hypothetical protein